MSDQGRSQLLEQIDGAEEGMIRRIIGKAERLQAKINAKAKEAERTRTNEVTNEMISRLGDAKMMERWRIFKMVEEKSRQVEEEVILEVRQRMEDKRNHLVSSVRGGTKLQQDPTRVLKKAGMLLKSSEMEVKKFRSPPSVRPSRNSKPISKPTKIRTSQAKDNNSISTLKTSNFKNENVFSARINLSENHLPIRGVGHKLDTNLEKVKKEVHFSKPCSKYSQNQSMPNVSMVTACHKPANRRPKAVLHLSGHVLPGVDIAPLLPNLQTSAVIHIVDNSEKKKEDLANKIESSLRADQPINDENEEAFDEISTQMEKIGNSWSADQPMKDENEEVIDEISTQMEKIESSWSADQPMKDKNEEGIGEISTQMEMIEPVGSLDRSLTLCKATESQNVSSDECIILTEKDLKHVTNDKINMENVHKSESYSDSFEEEEPRNGRLIESNAVQQEEEKYLYNAFKREDEEYSMTSRLSIIPEDSEETQIELSNGNVSVPKSEGGIDKEESIISENSTIPDTARSFNEKVDAGAPSEIDKEESIISENSAILDTVSSFNENVNASAPSENEKSIFEEMKYATSQTNPQASPKSTNEVAVQTSEVEAAAESSSTQNSNLTISCSSSVASSSERTTTSLTTSLPSSADDTFLSDGQVILEGRRHISVGEVGNATADDSLHLFTDQTLTSASETSKSSEGEIRQ